MFFKSRYFIFLVLSLFVQSQAIAVNVNYSVEAGVGYSDNIARTQDNQLNDAIRSIGGTLSIADESSTNDFVLDMDAAYVDYREDTFDDDLLVNLALASDFSLVNDSLTWTLDGFYGQQAINAFTATTPANLQDTGFLSTGPNLSIRFTSLDSLNLSYRYRNFYAEVTPDDYQSDLFRAVLARRLSPLHTLSLNVEHEDLTYDNPNNADFTSLESTIALAGSTTSNQYSLEVGVIDVEFEGGARGENDVYRFSFLRNLNSNNNISIQLSQTVDNGARAVTGTIPGVVTTGLFVNDLAQLLYSYNSGNLQVNLSAVYSDQDYISQNNSDQKVLNHSVGFVYGTPLNLQTSLRYFHLDREFYGANPVQVDKEDTITLSLEKRIARNLNIVGTYINFMRDSEQDNVQSQDIEENRIIVTLRYLGRI